MPSNPTPPHSLSLYGQGFLFLPRSLISPTCCLLQHVQFVYLLTDSDIIPSSLSTVARVLEFVQLLVLTETLPLFQAIPYMHICVCLSRSLTNSLFSILYPQSLSQCPWSRLISCPIPEYVFMHHFWFLAHGSCMIIAGAIISALNNVRSFFLFFLQCLQKIITEYKAINVKVNMKNKNYSAYSWTGVNLKKKRKERMGRESVRLMYFNDNAVRSAPFIVCFMSGFSAQWDKGVYNSIIISFINQEIKTTFFLFPPNEWMNESFNLPFTNMFFS